MGERNAKRYFATAERFDAEEAKRINLAHKIFEHDSFADDCEDFLQKLIANGPNAVYQSKALINFVANEPISEDLIRETAQRIADIRASSEGKEGVGAFLEKRPPQWSKIKDKLV